MVKKWVTRIEKLVRGKKNWSAGKMMVGGSGSQTDLLRESKIGRGFNKIGLGLKKFEG